MNTKTQKKLSQEKSIPYKNLFEYLTDELRWLNRIILIQVLGIVAKGVTTIVFKGVQFAAKGAIFAAKGIYKVGKKLLRGTFSVVEKIIGKMRKKIYYFYDEAAQVLRQIPAKFAKKSVVCTACKLNPAAIDTSKRATKISKKLPQKTRDIFAELSEELGLKKSVIPLPKKEWFGKWAQVKPEVFKFLFGAKT